MNAIKAVYHNGQIVPREPIDWPEGTELRIEPMPRSQTLGVRDEEWPTDPEGLARHLALMDQIEPLLMTPQEEAEWQAARKAQKEFDKAAFDERAEKLRGMWE